MLSSFFLLVSLKCYGDLGCFPVDGPFHSMRRPFSVPPRDPALLNVSFLAYTRARHRSPHVVSWINSTSRDFRLPTDAFNVRASSKVIIHGFHEDGFTKEWIKNLVNELLVNADINVMVVDWGVGASMAYPEAAANARLVGAILAKFISNLKENYHVSPESFHLIGHSLGAHVAGYAGERLHRLGRITGLDPAQPYFESTDPVVRLDPSDATFVDVIHTDAKSVYKGGLGMWQPCGHVDFYPNGGRNQPGCNGDIMAYVHKQKGDFIQGIRNWFTCRHKRAHELFTETVNSACPFLAVECSSHNRFRQGSCFKCENNNGFKGRCASMGFHAKPPNIHRTTNKFYLHTGNSKSYCRYHRRVTVYLGVKSQRKSEKGRLFARLITSSGIHSQRLKFLPKQVDFSSGRVVSSVVGTVNTENVTTVRLMWKSDDFVNPLDFFNGIGRYIWVDWITVETLETGDRVVLCPKNHRLVPDKVYVFTTGGDCGYHEVPSYSDNRIPP